MKKEKPRGKQTGRRQMIADSLRLPKDIVLGASIVTVTGRSEALVENYKGIIEYSDEEILLQGKNGQICFSGKRLSIDYYTNEDMKISGSIECVRYL